MLTLTWPWKVQTGWGLWSGEAQKGGTGHAGRGIRLALSTMYNMYKILCPNWFKMDKMCQIKYTQNISKRKAQVMDS